MRSLTLTMQTTRAACASRRWLTFILTNFKSRAAGGGGGGTGEEGEEDEDDDEDDDADYGDERPRAPPAAVAGPPRFRPCVKFPARIHIREAPIQFMEAPPDLQSPVCSYSAEYNFYKK